MPSVFESFGWKSQADSTDVPQLGISNRLNQLQIASQSYFTLGENARAADGDILAVSVKNGQDFDLKNEAHRLHLRFCIDLFKDKAKVLKSLDQKLALSTVLGIVATSLSFLPFVAYFGILGWGASIYYMTQRKVVETEYKEALNLLVASCNWSLGEGPELRKSNQEDLTTNEDIREMMTCLYPALTEKQARHLIADDIEDSFVQELRNYESKYRLTSTANNFFTAGQSQDERIAQSKRGAEFTRCVYGFNKGKTSDYIDAVFSIFPDIYHAVHHGFKRVQHWWNSGSKKAEAENVSAEVRPAQ